jgi:hypothetical protein
LGVPLLALVLGSFVGVGGGGGGSATEAMMLSYRFRGGMEGFIDSVMERKVFTWSEQETLLGS